MNRHQVLCGAVNEGDHTFASGAVHGLRFTVSVCDQSIATARIIGSVSHRESP